MKRLNPNYQAAVIKGVNKSPYFDLISMEIKEFDWGQCRIEVSIQEKHLQPFGMVHGGVFSSLVDAASFWAVYPEIHEDLGLTTVEVKVNYLAPSSKGYLIAKGKTIKMGRTLCLGEATIEDEKGRLLAQGASTMMILKDLKIRGQRGLPPKFLDS